MTQHRAVFLDFDGVLHPSVLARFDDPPEPCVGADHFRWLPSLAAALQSHPDVAVVVHSTWRYTHTIEELRGILGALGTRFVGTTPRGPRYESILWWLHMNPLFRGYRILDDDPTEFPVPLPSELILCDPQTGVSAPTVLAAIRQWLEE